MPVNRGQAQQGETVRLGISFYLGGTLFDPYERRQVEILDSTAAVVQETIAAGSIVREALGLYYVDWAVPAAQTVAGYLDRWYFTATSGATEKQITNSFFVHTVTSTAGDYMSAAEAAAYLPDAEVFSDAEILELTRRCQETIESVCGQKFLPVTETRVFNGQGRATLTVRNTIQSVSQILVRGDYLNPNCIMDLTDLRIAPSGTMLGLGNVQPGGRGVSAAGRLEPGCGIFPSGFSNIAVTGVWGMYTQVPREIESALGMLMRHAAACDDPLGPPSHAFESESVAGDRSFTLRKVWANIAVDGTTGFREVDAILARFMAPPVVMGVI